jgi:hypothetical protein
MQLPLKPVFEDVIATQKPIEITKKYYNTYLKDQLKRIGKDHLISDF